jgi:hypothetical protein
VWNGLHIATVLLQNRLADAESQAGPAPRPLGGIERIKDVRQYLGRNAGPIVLERGPYELFMLAGSYSERTPFFILPHRLLSIQDEIQEDLHQLPRLPNHRGEFLVSREIDRDVCFTQ